MIQIIGAGAIGCLWLAKLQQSGHLCHIVSRHKQLLNTLNFTDLTTKTEILPISHSHHLLNNSLNEQRSTILVCVKAPQVVNALLDQQVHINDQQAIILMHNGYGCAEQVLLHFPNNPIICATTANASLLDSPLSVTHTGAGPSYLGYFNKTTTQSPAIIQQLELAIGDVHWTEDIESKCWLKLIINAVINPLTAINQIMNGQLRAANFSDEIQEVIIECVTIAEAESLHFNVSTLRETIDTVILATAQNHSSMNRDIYYQRQTEIEFINGYLIKKAQQHDIAAPALTHLYNQIKTMECH